MRLRTRSLASIALLALAACGAKHAAVEDLTTNQPLIAYHLDSVRGARDGDLLDAQAIFTGASTTLTLDLRFRIGSPTRLESGHWSWPRDGQQETGEVSERSVTFLGGQNGPPSFAARLDLLDHHTARYRVTIPLTQLGSPLPMKPPKLITA